MVMIQTILPVCWFMCDVYEERRRGEKARREEIAKEAGGFGHEPAKRSVEHCERSTHRK